MITMKHCLGMTILTILFLNISVNAKVSKSFVRGFLVGYAKGLEEGKAMAHPMVHHVACAFHPIPEHEPEPYHPPAHHEPDHESHGGPHGYSSNSHQSRAVPGSSTVSESTRQPGHPAPPPSTLHEDKKAAASNAIQKAVLEKYA